jgi:hypothetical protein
MSTTDRRQESFADLARDFSHDISRLVRDEIALARAEMTQTGKRAAPGISMIGGAGLFALGAFGALTALIVIALDGFMPLWAAAAIVPAVYGLVALVLWQRGKDRVAQAGMPVPTRTLESVKEDVRWAKSHATSNGG